MLNGQDYTTRPAGEETTSRPETIQSASRGENVFWLWRDTALILALIAALVWLTFLVSQPAAYIGLTLALTAAVVWGLRRIDRGSAGYRRGGGESTSPPARHG
jgi:flagellar biogenesis protein FliO